MIRIDYKTLSCVQKLDEIIFNLCNLKHHCLIWQFTYILIHNRKLHDIWVEIWTLWSPIFTYIIASYESKVCFLFVYYVEFLLIALYALTQGIWKWRIGNFLSKWCLIYKKVAGFLSNYYWTFHCVTKTYHSIFPISI